MLRRSIHSGFLGAACLVLTAYPSWSANYDWGTIGVADTTVVTNIEQLTTNVVNDGVVSGDYPTSSGFAPTPWSTAGDWIVYTANTNTTTPSNSDREIFAIMPDGTGMTRLTTNVVEDSNASFGSDGKVYFERYNGSTRFELFRIDRNGTNETNLTTAHPGTAGEQNVLLSPDSTKIAYLSNNALWVANSDGTSPVQVSAVGYQLYNYNGNHCWSPDSSKVAYNCYEATTTYTYQVCVVNADGTGHNQLTTSGNSTWPAWSPDGSRIAFLREESPLYKVMTINPDGSGSATVDEFTTGTVPGWDYLFGPLSWSPDGNWVAYLKRWWDSAYTYTLNIANVTTLTKHQLTQDFNDFAPFWSPSGSQILFADSRFYTSRDDSDAVGVGTNNHGDLLLMNLLGEYGIPPEDRFPWTMFLPAINSGGKK